MTVACLWRPIAVFFFALLSACATSDLPVNNAVNNDVDSPNDGTWYNVGDNPESQEKRAPALSFNQDVMSLVQMLHQRKLERAHHMLGSLGKRSSWSMTQDLMSLANLVGEKTGRRRYESAKNLFSALGKRAPMSFTQDLNTLARMIQNQRLQKAHNHLSFLGKRSNLSFDQDLMSLVAMLDAETHRRRLASAQSLFHSLGKRGGSAEVVEPQRPQLSVGIPLGTISDMIHAQRRRQYMVRAKDVRQQLTNLGKRNAESTRQEDNQ